MNAHQTECEAAVAELEAAVGAAGGLAAALNAAGVGVPGDGVGCRLAAWFRRRLDGAGAAVWVTAPPDNRLAGKPGSGCLVLVRKGLTNTVLARVPLPRAMYEAAEADRVARELRRAG